MIYPKIGFSRKKKLPCLWFTDKTYSPHKIFSLLEKGYSWTILDMNKEKDYMRIKHREGFEFFSDLYYGNLIINEWCDWKKAYFMPFSLKGKTILDVGAGCGETAFFFFVNGAEKVICIEKQEKLLKYLLKNKNYNNWNLKVVIDSFNLGYLNLDFDLAKIDIEGNERELLNTEIDFPLCLEVHNKKLEEEFAKRGFKKVWKMNEDVSVMNNYENIEKIRNVMIYKYCK